ncbi:MAG TPA: multiheme c-type cytochrome [Methylomirabilota bacterium]|nr:multiheme c-type cytochrome [Methylomirabilota bacterium]
MSHRFAWGAFVGAVAIAAVVAGGLIPNAPLAPERVHAQAKLKYTGAASCGASNCHGSTKPKADYPKLNENIIWFQKDKHAKGYDTLINEKLKSGVSPSKIAANMKIGKPEQSSKCLVCHAVDVPKEQRGPKFDITEGVHCDGCHGPAEKWLEPHAEKGWTHEQSVKVGMYDTKNFLLRAENCVSCHLQIDHEMVAAGHPDLLAFELDTFSLQMPPHWRDKGTWVGTKAWATGQVISMREAAKQLGERAAGNASAQLLRDALAKVQGHGAVVRALMGVVAPDAQKTVEADLTTLADAVAKNDKGKISAAAKNLQATMQAQAPRVAGREFDEAGTRKLLADIAAAGDAIGATGLRAAEQAAMALDRLYSTYSKAPGKKADPAASKALDAMFGTLDDPKKYDGKAFAGAAKAFSGALK